MRKLFLMFLFLLSVSFIHAQSSQTRIVTGTISDQNGVPIPGVNVIVSGTTIGTITDLDGKFSINIPDDAENLQFSFVDFC